MSLNIEYKDENKYSRQEVADILGISKATVYHYAKQRKIKKVPDPHKIMREAYYYKEEVDKLAEEKNQQEKVGYSTSQLSKRLGVSSQKIYALIKEYNLNVNEIPYGDERFIYDIPETTAKWIEQELKRTSATRGIRSEFYDSTLDLAIFQLFTSNNQQVNRLLRNKDGDWGFLSSSGSWIPYDRGITKYEYTPVYNIHRPLIKMKGRGYTDFILPKDSLSSFLFLDFIYANRGIENIRLREYEEHLSLSVKSGLMQIISPIESTLTIKIINSFLQNGGAGEILFDENEWNFISGYRKTAIELPISLIEDMQKVADQEQMYTNELIEKAIQQFIDSKISKNSNL